MFTSCSLRILARIQASQSQTRAISLASIREAMRVRDQLIKARYKALIQGVAFEASSSAEAY